MRFNWTAISSASARRNVLLETFEANVSRASWHEEFGVRVYEIYGVYGGMECIECMQWEGCIGFNGCMGCMVENSI